MEREALLVCDTCGPIYQIWRVEAQNSGVYVNRASEASNDELLPESTAVTRCPRCSANLRRA